MIAQRRVENGFREKVLGNNPMNLKGKGDLGQVAATTREVYNGVEQMVEGELFASFSSNEAGFEAYFSYLNTNWNKSYKALFDDSKTVSEFAEALVENPKQLYATDPNYKERIIEDFGTTKRDYIIWYECMLTCPNHTDKEQIKRDLELLKKIK